MGFNPSIIAPELYVLLVTLALMVQSLGPRDWKPHVERWLPIFAGLGVLVTLAAAGSKGLILYGSYRIDGLSQFIKVAVVLGWAIAVANASRQPTLEDGKKADYFFFLTLSAWGLMLLASCAELITVYVALEVSSYSLYALVPLRARDRDAAEAGIKYILFGAAATALSLYGLSYVIAAQHSTYLMDLAQAKWSFAEAPMAVIGISLFLAGMFYKLALFPFHFWCPDVYQGASNETAGYIATVPKLGAMVVLIRIAALFQPGLPVTDILAVLGAVSMTFGNLAALAQTDVKRILGYSSVAHAGYVVVGLVSGTADGLAASSFYVLAYVLMNLTCFWVLSRAASDGRNLDLNGLNGLYRRAPALAFAMAVGAFALVGLPPMVGFMGKLSLFTAAWGKGYDWLVITAGANTAISIYYYLNMVRHAYTKEPEADAAEPDASLFSSVGAGVLAALVLILGVFPAPVVNAALDAGRQLLP